jgi:hypothetical protein
MCVFLCNHDGLIDADVGHIIVDYKTTEVEGKQALPSILEGII